MNFKLEKIYYYIICLLAFFVLMWGAIDFISAGTTYLTTPDLPASPQSQQGLERAEVNFDAYYQKKVSQDRVYDSLARIFVSGLVLAFCRYKIAKMEVE